MNQNNRLRSLGAAAAAAAALMAAACAPTPSNGTSNDTGTPRDGGSLTIGVGEALTTWNVVQALTVTDFQVVKEVFEPLVVNTADGTGIQGALADSFSYDSSRTVLTFKLPPTAAFSDGTPLTSADVEMTVDSSNAANILTAQAIQAMVAKAGITMRVKPLDVSTLIAQATGGQNRMGITTYRATSLTLNDILSLWYATGVFFSGADSAPILAAARAVAAARDESQLEAADQQVEKFVFASKFWVPVANLNIIFAIKPRVRGLTVNPLVLYNLNDLYTTS